MDKRLNSNSGRSPPLGNLVLGYKVDLAALQTTTVYVLVATLFWFTLMHFSVDYFWTRNIKSKIPITIIISALDSAASMLALHSYGYVSMPTVTLLSTFSTPTVMLLSWLFLSTKYKKSNILGAFIAISGVAGASIYQLMNISQSSDSQTSKLPYMGHAMCLVSAFMYGISNVLTENVTKNGGSLAEYLAMNSTFSAIWSFSYLIFWRRSEITMFAKFGWSWVGLHFILYCLNMVLFYSLLPIIMMRSSATLFNLSLLTVNFMSLFVGTFIFNESFAWQFLLAFGFVMLGLIMFNWRPVQPTTLKSDSSIGGKINSINNF